jgi:AraC family transcriptional regulator of adaptative response/methylated-DNA-[protein]-cysteine methyltransferase
MTGLDNSQALLDYRRIEKAITFLHANRIEQPDLATVARAAHLSEFHFQKVFTRWAGISPKRFLQCLTLEHAKDQLNACETILDTALNSGLSGPGRLHDLFVTIEAVTPGEFKSRGQGIRIAYGFHPTPFGMCLLGLTERGVCWLSFLTEQDRNGALGELKEHWHGAQVVEDAPRTVAVIRKIFAKTGSNGLKSIGLLMMGTNFQIKVWQALLSIPTGAVVSYERIGQMVGAPKSSRAIGSAVGSNCISYLIPCHRVIRKTGVLGGYRWGEARKHAILSWEAASTKAA